MTDNILIDKLLSNSNLSQLNDYSLVLLSNLESNDSSTAEIIKDQFTKLYLILKPLIDEQTNGKHKSTTVVDIYNHSSLKLNKRSTIQSITSILSFFKDGLIDTSNDDLIELQKLILVFSLIVLLIASSQFLLHNTLPLMDDLNYYDSVLSSNRNVFIYTLQSLPSNLLNISTKLLNEVKSRSLATNEEVLLNAIDVPTWLPKGFEQCYRNLSKWIELFTTSFSHNLRELLKSPTSFIIEKQRLSNNSAKLFLNATLGLPFYYSTVDLKSKRDNLINLQEQNVKRLGLLLSELPTVSISNGNLSIESTYSLIAKLSEVFDDFQAFDLNVSLIPPSDNQLGSSFKALYSLYSKLLPVYESEVVSLKIKNQQPTNLTKNWIIITLLAIYLPSIVSNIFSNRQAIFDWVRLNLVDTTIGFYHNWIVEPLDNILKTIRHDDNSRIAIMSQQSLNTDLESLERMVVDYTMDTSSEALMLSESQRNALSQQIKEEVSKGDLEVVMKGYESDLKSPIKSLATGNMIRNLLIQIQKIKVDGTLAMSGIDKLLKSQELVFGIVAASPAVLILWYSIQSFKTYLRTGYIIRVSKNYRISMIKSMSNLERLINIQLTKEDDTIDYFAEGLLYIELTNLRKLGLRLLPAYLKSDWIRDLNDLNDSDYKFKNLTIQRIWNTYGAYFRT